MMDNPHQRSVCGFMCAMQSPVVPASAALFLCSCPGSHKLTALPSSLDSRKDSGWRPSSVSVPNTQSLTAACPLAPPWQMYRKSIRSWRSCSSLMRTQCLKKPWWAPTPDTGATGKAPSTMRTARPSGAPVRAAPASFPLGVSGTMNCSGTSAGPHHHHPLPSWKPPASRLI